MVVVLPEKTMFPETSNLIGMVTFRIVVVPTTARVTLAAAMVALAMLATGMVTVPVKVASLMGAFSRFKESSAVFRSVIS